MSPIPFRLLCGLLLTLALPVQAASIAQIDTATLIRAPQLVFQGEVLDRRSRESANGRIHTYVDFQVEEVLVGDYAPGTLLTLRYAGGQVGDRGFSVGARIPEPGERGVYFVESLNGRLMHPLLGWSQGRFRIRSDGTLLAGNDELVTALEVVETTASPVLSRGVARGVKTRSVEAPASRSRGTAVAAPLSLEQFKTRLRELRQGITR